ncbi:unnamed protein product, partial [Allacma fusca]
MTNPETPAKQRLATPTGVPAGRVTSPKMEERARISCEGP